MNRLKDDRGAAWCPACGQHRADVEPGHTAWLQVADGRGSWLCPTATTPAAPATVTALEQLRGEPS